MLFDAARHEILLDTPWSKGKVQQVIADIVDAAISEFQGENFWPVHPDLLQEYKINQVITSLWHGAAGTIWAVDQLNKNDSSLPCYDFTPFLQTLRDKQTLWLSKSMLVGIDPQSPGYLFGYTGINMLDWKLTGRDQALIFLADNIEKNIKNLINELMWAAPGTMLCAWFLYQQTNDSYWRELFTRSADFLLSELQYDGASQCYTWTQHMYGADTMHLGAAHGFALVI